MTPLGAWVLAASFACAGPVARQDKAQAAAPLRARFIEELSGHWTGKLEYKDYQRPDRRVTRPTLLEVARARPPGAQPRVHL